MDLSNLRKTNTESSALTESDKTKMKEDKDKQPPKNIMETNTWKKGSSGISSMWKNYLAILDKLPATCFRLESYSWLQRCSQLGLDVTRCHRRAVDFSDV